MLIICNSILKKELKPLINVFPISHIIASAKKAKSGLCNIIKGSNIKDTKLVKIYLTGKSGAGRIVFLIIIKRDLYIPVILRLKKDKIIGNNITIKNKSFEILLETNLDMIFEDIKTKNYKEYII